MWQGGLGDDTHRYGGWVWENRPSLDDHPSTSIRETRREVRGARRSPFQTIDERKMATSVNKHRLANRTSTRRSLQGSHSSPLDTLDFRPLTRSVEEHRLDEGP